MAVRLFTADAKGLLAEIKKQIRNGEIQTWSVDSAGDFTHVTHDGQWKNKAWMRPTEYSDRLLLNIIRPKGGSISRPVYAVYHGRFIEMAIEHVFEMFSVARATPSADEGDLV
jgi:hypothetical protein